MRKRKVERKEKAVREKYLPVRSDRALVGKYGFVPGGDGFDLEHAQALCARVSESQPEYVPVPVKVVRWAVENGVRGTSSEVQVAYQLWLQDQGAS